MGRKRKRPQLEPYSTYLARQGNIEQCLICGAKPKRRRLDRDHSHKTGLPRGLLCAKCNRFLVYWFTSDWLNKAAEYLAKYKE